MQDCATPSQPETKPAPSPLATRALTVAYRRRPVLWDVDCSIESSSLTAIIGPNGAGKSTLLKACVGLTPKATGTVTFWEKPLAKARNRIGYVPQRESVDWDFPISVLDVVLMGRARAIGWIRPISSSHKREALDRLERVGMADFANRQIGELSGGQQQRVFLARALAQDADLYLMDEPFAGVDAASAETIMRVLRKLSETGVTVVCVHHDLHTATTYFDHALLLNTRVIASGPIKKVLTPDRLHATYGGRLAVLDQAGLAPQPEVEGAS